MPNGLPPNRDLIALIERANAAGVRLEIIGGLPVWEAFPARRHQQTIDRIRATITQQPSLDNEAHSCACIHIADVYIRFPDGSLKRPDISLFCREPDELDEAITLVPEAVIEVISPGYETKDLELAPRFYLLQGVKDVVVIDPHTLLVLHMRRNATARLVSPVSITFECGCQCIV